MCKGVCLICILRRFQRYHETGHKHSRPFLSPSMAGRTACGAVWAHSRDAKIPNIQQEQEHRGVCFRVEVV